jgi:hypothetical protein
MDIIRGIKDIFLLTPYFIVLLLAVMLNTIIHLLFGFVEFMIFIYKRLQWR